MSTWATERLSIISGQLGLRPGAGIYLKNESLLRLNESPVVLLLRHNLYCDYVDPFIILGEWQGANVEQDKEHVTSLSPPLNLLLKLEKANYTKI